MKHSIDDFPLLRAARQIRPRIESFAAQVERDRKLPQPLVDELAQAGFFKMLVPKDYGGSEVTPEQYLRVLETLATADASTAWVVALIACNSISAGYLPAHVADAMFSHVPGAGIAGSIVPKLRDPEARPNQAIVVDGGYRVSGSWSFASGCMHATTLFSTCPVYTHDKPRLHSDGRIEQRWFYFPASRCKITEDWSMLGMSGTGSNSFAVEDEFVANDFSLPASSPIEPVHPGVLYSYASGAVFDEYYFPFAGISKPTLTGISLGVTRAILDAFAAHLQVGHGAARLRQDRIVLDRFGQAEAILRAARAYQYETLREAWESVVRHGRRNSNYLKDLALAGTHTATLTNEAVDLIWRTAGITAAFVPSAFERRFRDLRVANQNGAFAQANYAAMGQYLLNSSRNAE